MDYKYIVEKRDGYKRENLTADEEMFIRGWEAAAEEIECASRNLFDDGDLLIERLISEIQQDAADQLREWVDLGKYEYIVAMIDSHAEAD